MRYVTCAALVNQLPRHSVGVAIGGTDMANPLVLLRSADLAMYEAKSTADSGPN